MIGARPAYSVQFCLMKSLLLLTVNHPTLHVTHYTMLYFYTELRTVTCKELSKGCSLRASTLV